ncbi:type VI secretion system protein TssA [Vibrio panuliri]|uniref:Type VI secretion system ImpA domain-containing protein n=1 Tax=Vibrio panuliri TaxID=1381081 RepID=A0ABX3FFZ7_9VIBR|nr:type VI secretion system protein TssA [Vibrio panuliri]KAB1453831.1 type VI secretion system protein TssA [Vibrio panuliri]OLQ92001.1 type VI secretion system ImpA domain-containing protein [Vibrio panuliri]
MELTQYRASIVRPISNDSPVGERLLDEPLFDFIEDQMMKVGSLSHASVQWQEVEHSAITLLNEKSKDVKLLVYLLQCLHHQLTPNRLIVSFGVMSDFIQHYWDECYPAPGKRGNLPRRKFFSQMCQRFSMAMEKFEFASLDAQAREELQAAVELWRDVIEGQNLASDLSESVVTHVLNQLTRQQEREKAQQNAAQTAATHASEQTSSGAVSSAITVDNSSDKAAKQTLLKVAEYLAEQEFGTALAIRVRRHALWGAITALPDHNKQGETLLRGMQTERVKEYQDQLQQPDLALWRKVEQSLVNAPYWFEGQLMSYEIAKALGQERWCHAIQEETQAFVERFPSVSELKFKDGSAFLPDAVRDWLSRRDASSGGAPITGSWQDKREEAFNLARDGGIAVAMSMLNDGLVSAVEPRERFYWRLLSADLLQQYHLEAMAKGQYQTLQQEIMQTSVTEWEPSLIAQLERNTAAD